MAFDELHDVEVEVVYQYIGGDVVLGPCPGVVIIPHTWEVSVQPLFCGLLGIGTPGCNHKNFVMN